MSSVPQQVYDKLFAAYGPQQWWPGESAFEIAVGAILVQNTSWKNVEKALENLKLEGLLSTKSLLSLAEAELETLIRPAGYYRIKTRRLRNWLNMLAERFDGSLQGLFDLGLEKARQTLLAVSGIGPETADAMLLYAGGLPSFVVDNYTHRVFKRHGWIEQEADYHQLQEFLQDGLHQDPALFNEYHALLVKVGHTHCKPAASCDGCPLQDMLPEGGMETATWD